VKFKEPAPKEFEINDSLEFIVQSDTPVNKLRARVFWERKKDLIARAEHAPVKGCVYYPSFVVPFQSANGEIKFAWQFRAYFLKQVSDDAFENQPYTVVLEKDGPVSPEEFRLYPKDVEAYFQSGQEIVVIAPPSLQSGARATVEEVRSTRIRESQNVLNRAQGPESPPAEEKCIVVKTRQVAAKESTGELAELLLESCRTLAQ
jgi:hypothetical protein